jgi:hypothetical protein
MAISALCCVWVALLTGLALLLISLRKGNPFQNDPRALPIAVAAGSGTPLLPILFYLYPDSNHDQSAGTLEFFVLGLSALGWGSLLVGLVAFYFREK